MNLKKLESIVDHSIPYVLALLLLVIIVDFFFYDESGPYRLYIEMLDVFVILIFVIDLSFKYSHMRKIQPFIKRYWLEIIAIFPFYIAFRVVEEAVLLAGFSEGLRTVQRLFHEGLGVERITAAGIARAGRVTRAEGLARFFQPVFRSLRFVSRESSFYFFEKPAHRKKKKR